MHHSKLVKDACEKLEFELIFNLPYSPENNPIENVFSIVKNEYRRIKLAKVANNLDINHEEP